MIAGVTQSLASVDVHEQISEEKKKRAGFVMGGEVANKLQERMKELNESLSKTVEENQNICHMDFDGQKDGLSPQKESSLEDPSQWMRKTENAPLRDTTLPPVLKPNLHAPIPQGFSPEVYLFFNKDVAQKYRVGTLSKTDAAIDHYKKYGYKEKRSYGDKYFDPESYLSLNSDVATFAANYSDKWAFAAFHYYVLAPLENRPFIPSNFDAELYLKLNPDVATAAKSMADPTSFAVTHYLTYGRKEKRHYDVPIPSDFVASVYYQLNDDVLQAVLTSNDALDFAAQHHYRHYGYFEGRSYKY